MITFAWLKRGSGTGRNIGMTKMTQKLGELLMTKVTLINVYSYALSTRVPV